MMASGRRMVHCHVNYTAKVAVDHNKPNQMKVMIINSAVYDLKHALYATATTNG